jgi:drug/metabolite transporter (DMT)-like permease
MAKLLHIHAVPERDAGRTVDAAGAADHSGDRMLLGALLVTAASLVFAVNGALVKMLAPDTPNTVIVFCRNAMALVVLLPWYLAPARRAGLKTVHPLRHLTRTASGLGAMYLFFFILGRMPLAEAVLLSFTAPLFIPLVARAWIKEAIVARTRWAIALGFVGVVMILRPGSGLFQPVALLGLLSGMLVAVAMVSIRRMSDTEPPGRIVFYFTALSALISALPLPWTWQTPPPAILGMLLLVAMLAVCGQMLSTRGYGLAPSARVAPFTYTMVVFSALLGWLLWGEAVGPLTWVGAAAICGAGTLSTRGR